MNEPTIPAIDPAIRAMDLFNIVLQREIELHAYEPEVARLLQNIKDNVNLEVEQRKAAQ